MRIKYISLLIALIGIAALYTLSLFAQAPSIELSQLPAYENEIVTTQGTITKYYQNDYGNQIITIRNNNTTATIFASVPATVQSGDTIQATGKVEHYKETWEIIIDDPKDLTIIKKWNETTIQLWEIAQNPITYVECNLNVTGYIDSIYESSLYFTDNNFEHTILVMISKKENITFYPGEPVVLSAQLLYDSTQLKYFFSLSETYHHLQPITEETIDD
ncbi:MAG: hypothetical protein V1769_01610 [Thermoplasmatota archaeon]